MRSRRPGRKGNVESSAITRPVRTRRTYSSAPSTAAAFRRPGTQKPGTRGLAYSGSGTHVFSLLSHSTAGRIVHELGAAKRVQLTQLTRLEAAELLALEDATRVVHPANRSLIALGLERCVPSRHAGGRQRWYRALWDGDHAKAGLPRVALVETVGVRSSRDGQREAAVARRAPCGRGGGEAHGRAVLKTFSRLTLCPTPVSHARVELLSAPRAPSSGPAMPKDLDKDTPPAQRRPCVERRAICARRRSASASLSVARGQPSTLASLVLAQLVVLCRARRPPRLRVGSGSRFG